MRKRLCIFPNMRGVNFTIATTKLYAPVVTLPIKHNTKLLENLKQGFKRTISWNKHRSEIKTEPKTKI